jgi:hypothetical protein
MQPQPNATASESPSTLGSHQRRTIQPFESKVNSWLESWRRSRGQQAARSPALVRPERDAG